MTDIADGRLDVAVSGGSMAGLFTGLALREAGHSVEVFERSDGDLQSRGAGIVAQPRMLGFLDDRDIAAPEAVTTRTTCRRYLLRDGTVDREYDEPMRFTSWDAVYRRLRDAFPDDQYHMNRRTAAIENESGGATLRFEDDDPVHADLAVVAEGGQSRTRATFLPEVTPEYAGYVAWRGVVPEDAVSSGVRDRFTDSFTFYHEGRDLVLGYLIPGPNGGTEPGERRLNWVWYDDLENRDDRRRLLTDERGREHAFAVSPGALDSGVEDELRTAAERLPDVFSALVNATDDPFVQTIYDLSVPEMVFGRVCLVGDCAFVARPHTAAGTAKAATDGIELAAALDENSATALGDWERARLDAGRRLVAEGERMGRDYMN